MVVCGRWAGAERSTAAGPSVIFFNGICLGRYRPSLFSLSFWNYILYGRSVDAGAWNETVGKIQHLDIRYQASVDKVLQGLVEAILQAEPK